MAEPVEKPSEEEYNLLVRAFKLQLTQTGRTNFESAGIAAGVSTSVARMAWYKGWTTRPVFLPIRSVIERARLLARGRVAKASRQLLAAEVEVERDAATDIAQQFAVELIASRQGLLAAQALISNAAQLSHALEPVRARLVKELAEVAADEDASVARLMRVMREVAEFTQISLNVAKQQVDVHDRIVGKREGVPPPPPPQAAQKEKLDMLLAFMSSLRRHVAGGVIPMLEPPPPTQVIEDAIPTTAEAVGGDVSSD